MNIGDIFKNSFLEGFAGELTAGDIILSLGSTTLLCLYIFFIYRLVTRKTFYSKTMNISLAAISLITCGIILTIQSSIVISLGMVGALSIVRFRTAVKDPMDLMFLFWAISNGIICGAGLWEIAAAVSLLLTALVFLLDKLPVGKAPMLLMASGEAAAEAEMMRLVQRHARSYKVKSRSRTAGQIDLVVELRLKDDAELLNAITAVAGVASASLMSHDGEVTY